MRYPLLVVFGCLTLAGCSAEEPQGTPFEPAFAMGGGREISVVLSGANEVPPNSSTATGTFTASMNSNDELCYVLTATGLSSPLTGAHIHRAPAGVVGGIVIPLTVPTGGQSSDCVTVDKGLLKEIRKSPEQFYVNVHTQNFRPGEIRAQLGS